MRRVMLSILLLLFSFSAFGQTYSDLAQKYIAKQYLKVLTHLDIINNSATPYDGKGIRKDIGKLKIYLDVFQYAYTEASEKDLLLEIRDDLDLGYEVVGQFKDLYDTLDADEVDEDLLNSRRSKAIEWKQEFLGKAQIYDYETYLATPLIGKVNSRKKKNLPKFFWRIIDFPKNSIVDGEKVISYLLNGMMDKSVKRYKEIMKFENLFKHDHEEAFHDFRKLVRAHSSLIEVFFEEQIVDGGLKRESFNTLDLMIDKFGDINDNLVGLHHAKSDKKKKKLKKKIRIQWYLLKAWSLEKDISKTLKEFKI